MCHPAELLIVGLVTSTFLCCRKPNQQAINGADSMSLLLESEVERLLVTLTWMVMMLIRMMGIMKERSLAVETSKELAISILEDIHYTYLDIYP